MFQISNIADKSDGSPCTDSPLEWTMLIVTMVSINVTWWLFDLPLLWYHGVEVYYSSVIWKCFRSYMPCCAAICALTHAQTPQEQPYIYYIGPFYDVLNRSTQVQSQSQIQGAILEIEGGPSPLQTDDTLPTRGLSRSQLIKSLVMDSLTIISTGVTLIHAASLPIGSDSSGLNSSTWAYPTLPVALIGLWLLFCGTWLQWSRKWTIWLGMLLIISIGAAIIVPFIVLSPAGQANKAWVGIIIIYGMMGLPILAFAQVKLALVATCLGFLARVGGIGIGSVSKAA